jgi:hypothetical protein
MIQLIVNMFRTPSAEEIRQRQLDEAKRSLAEFEVTLEYTIAMRDMFRTRIARLEVK